MEKKKSLMSNNSLKGYSLVNGAMMMRDSSNKRSQSSYQEAAEEDNNNNNYLNGFSWPPRCYTCSFCRREFISAQALGGHMNVHRKDRARLKCSPPRDHAHYTTTLLNLNLNPNPNLSSSSTSSPPSSPSSFISPFTSTFMPSHLISPAPPPPPPQPQATQRFSVPASENMKWAVAGGSLLSHPLNLKPNSDLSKKMKSNKSHQCQGLLRREDHQEGCIRKLKKADHDHQINNIVRLDLEIGVLGDSNKEADLDLELRLGYT